jgi:hypothetical protein
MYNNGEISNFNNPKCLRICYILDTFVLLLNYQHLQTYELDFSQFWMQD